MTILFWFTLILIGYTYVGYPLTIALLARFRARAIRQRAVSPFISLVIVAHNEAQCIERKLRNSLALDYPRDLLEIVVASDGSTDDTVEIARRFSDVGVKVVALTERRGKPSVLNDVIPACSGEIVVLSDARQVYDKAALPTLTANFADPRVGAVSGELHLESRSGTVADAVGVYWRHEKFIRRCESRFDSTVGATGAIYAIRRELFKPIPSDTVLDDVLIPLTISAAGYRVVFEPRAMAFDTVALTPRQELERKARTLAGNAQLFTREVWVWSPFRNRLWLQTVSHKALRLAMPFMLLVLLVASAALATTPFYLVALGGQLALYGAGAAGAMLPGKIRSRLGLSLPYGFCFLNVAAVIGVLRFWHRGQGVTWDKGARG